MGPTPYPTQPHFSQVGGYLSQTPIGTVEPGAISLPCVCACVFECVCLVMVHCSCHVRNLRDDGSARCVAYKGFLVCFRCDDEDEDERRAHEEAVL